jgi:hypothetical protein
VHAATEAQRLSHCARAGEEEEAAGRELWGARWQRRRRRQAELRRVALAQASAQPRLRQPPSAGWVPTTLDPNTPHLPPAVR